MFNHSRFIVSFFLLLAVSPIQIKAMESKSEQPTYITQCCNKILTTIDLTIAKQVAKITDGGCPYCDTIPFEVMRVTASPSTAPSAPKNLPAQPIIPAGTPYSAIIPPMDLYPAPAAQNVTSGTVFLINTHGQVFQTSLRTNQPQATQTRECRICSEDVQENDFAQLSCNHNFYCKSCIMDILDNAVREKNTHAMRCPECKQKFNDTELINITQGNRKKLSEITKVIKRELRKQTPGAKECATADCEYIHVPSNTNTAQTIRCPECRQSYCSQCLFNHIPSVNCTDAQLARQATDKNEQANLEWKNAHTKPCPKCSTLIQKAPGGCTKVECSKCTQVFCYDCLEKTKWTMLHTCKTATTTTNTTSQTQSNNNNSDSSDDENSDDIMDRLIKLIALKQALQELQEERRKERLEMLEKMLGQISQPQASMTEGSSTQEQQFKYFIVRFNTKVTETFFDKFIRFITQLGQGNNTRPTVKDYATFKEHGQKLSFVTTMTKDEFQELLTMANDSELE